MEDRRKAKKNDAVSYMSDAYKGVIKHSQRSSGEAGLDFRFQS